MATPQSAAGSGTVADVVGAGTTAVVEATGVVATDVGATEAGVAGAGLAEVGLVDLGADEVAGAVEAGEATARAAGGTTGARWIVAIGEDAPKV